MRTFLIAILGGVVAVAAMRGLERHWDGQPSAALAAARLLQRAELDLQCMTEQLEQRVVALTPPAGASHPQPAAPPKAMPETTPSPALMADDDQDTPATGATAVVLASHDVDLQLKPSCEAAARSRDDTATSEPSPDRATRKAMQRPGRTGGDR